ncbi:MAG: ERF family protein [Betaproteobacteria bacterium]
MEYMSEEIGEISKALASAQGEYDIVIKGDTVKMKVYSKKLDKYIDMSYKFATLSTIQEAIRKPFKDNDLSYVHQLIGDKLVCRLMHSSGQWLASSYQLRFADQGNIDQEMGKIITYGRRYTLAAIAGIAQEDDDAASQNDPTTKTSINGNEVVNAKIEDRPKPQRTAKQRQEAAKQKVDAFLNEIGFFTDVVHYTAFTARESKMLQGLYERHPALFKDVKKALDNKVQELNINPELIWSPK